MRLYTGRAAGTHALQQGGGSNILCLPDEPEFLDTAAGMQDGRARVYPVEYQIDQPFPGFTSLLNHDIPCSVCHTSARGDVIVIPGKVNCPDSWTREYYGYLMAGYHSHYRTTFECVDVNAEAFPGGAADINGALLAILH